MGPSCKCSLLKMSFSGAVVFEIAASLSFLRWKNGLDAFQAPVMECQTAIGIDE